MLSRAASSIYWMSRYLERADNVSRFLDVNAHLILDMGWENTADRWLPLIHSSGDEADYNKRYDSITEENVIYFLTFDIKNPNSILYCIQQAREAARTLREIISTEMWESINTLYHRVNKESRNHTIGDLQIFFKSIRDANNLFTGLSENTMSHTEAWHFAKIGKMIERTDKTTRLLDVKYFSLLPQQDYFESPYDSVEWGAVLKSVDGFEMYLKRFHRANLKDVTKFLLFDAYFPRSVRHCIEKAAFSLQCIIDFLDVNPPAQLEIKALKSTLEEAHLEQIFSNGLHEFIDGIQRKLNEIDESLYDSFFSLERKAPLEVQRKPCTN